MTLPGHRDAINERPGHQDPGPKLGTAAGAAELRAAAEAAKTWLAANGLDRLGRPLDEPASEVWRSIPGYDGLYEASSLGRVRSFYRDRRILSTKGTDETGYPVVSLNKDGKRRTYTLHRLICRAFHGEPPPLRREVAHLDGSRDNCRADNLKWVSKVENESHKVAHGTRQRGEDSPCSRYTEDQVRRLKRLLAKGVGVTKGAKITGISYTAARHIADGRRWQHVTVESPPPAREGGTQ